MKHRVRGRTFTQRSSKRYRTKREIEDIHIKARDTVEDFHITERDKGRSQKTERQRTFHTTKSVRKLDQLIDMEGFHTTKRDSGLSQTERQ